MLEDDRFNIITPGFSERELRSHSLDSQLQGNEGGDSMRGRYVPLRYSNRGSIEEERKKSPKKVQFANDIKIFKGESSGSLSGIG